MVSHIVPLGIKCIEVVADFLFRNDEIIQFPFDSHIEYAVIFINVLVKVNDITAVFVDKTCYYCDNACFIRAVHS